jgi:hypothetical protein
MSSNEKVMNYKILVLIDIYNFGFGHFCIRYRLKILNFKL